MAGEKELIAPAYRNVSHSRNVSEITKTPHSVSLKVLRLSKPQFYPQQPLPAQHSVGTSDENAIHVDKRAALAYPSDDPKTGNEFVLSPLLTLPPSFGTVHVGETFTCMLCANNELNANVNGRDNATHVTDVKISADMQSPSNSEGTPLELDGKPFSGKESTDLQHAEILPQTLRFQLHEEGPHVLSVTVSYIESTKTGMGAELPSTAESNTSLTPRPPGRTRTFRKLYQFVAHALLSVRTKAQAVPLPSKSLANSISQTSGNRYVLEAQIENLSDISVCLANVKLTPNDGLSVKSLNFQDLGPAKPDKGHNREATQIYPGEVHQVCFLLDSANDGLERGIVEPTKDKRTPLGQLTVDWRGPMGERGELSTGWLTCREKP